MDERTGFTGYGHLAVLRLRFRMASGRMSPIVEREVLHRGDGAAVAPIDVEAEEILLVEQFRPGAWKGTANGWVLECPAGQMAPGETPQETATREAFEETGCVIADLVHVASVLTNPTAMTETVHVFYARITASNNAMVHGVNDEREETRCRTLSIGKIGEGIAKGKIVDAKSMIALQHIQMHWEAMKNRWKGDRACGAK